MNKIRQFKMKNSGGWPKYDLKITLKPCFKCNHKCWFCDEYDNKTKMWSKQDVDHVLETISEIPDDKNRLFFYFYGGEPTLSEYWEHLNCELMKMFPDRVLFIQTQTNMSMSEKRLDRCLNEMNKVKGERHTIDICSSYHLGKQTVDDFIKKMKICEIYECLGYCFFSTEIRKHDQCIAEFTRLTQAYPDKVKLRFTEINNLKNKHIPEYEQLLKDEYLSGSDDGKSLEFRYWLRKYPEWRRFFEREWDFDVDGTTYNFSEVSGNNIHMKFKHMKCECGSKNIVIDHNLNVYHCNDDFYNKINITQLKDVNMKTYISKDVRCLNSTCYDGLDFRKYK